MDWGKNVNLNNEKSKILDELRAQEENVWHQRSRVKWLREGDANTSFFHQSTLQWRRRNKVLKLKDGDGDWVDNQSHIRQLVDDHFLKLFKSGGIRDWGNMLDCVKPGITEDVNLSLMETVSLEEIKRAVFQMGGFKAPGPDGFQGIFYRSFWANIEGDVNHLIQSLIHDSVSPTMLNSTHIVLIPKVQNPESVSHFRPISFCNFSYKVLSKVLANRLKAVMPKIISPSQNAFVSGRQIQDNIGIAHEVFHFLKGRKSKHKFEMGIKIDMLKAYDRVEWVFLDSVMERMGFYSLWRKLIMGCVSSVKFAVILNGQLGKKFAPSRGLRQGNPLSPYLFLMVGEVLSSLIQVAVEKKLIDGVRLGVTGPVLSHIFFADDTLVFMRADEKNCRHLVKLLRDYCDASGQEVNLQKSSVYFGANTPCGVSQELGRILGMQVVGDPGTIAGKLQGWKQNTLSKAGKEVLIKAVVQAIPAYPMNIFKFPAVVCDDLDALVAGFWWGKAGGGGKIHWVSKEVLGLPKNIGGMGFRSFNEFNVALLAKQCWRGRASWAWSSLLSGRDLILQGTHWQILGGEDVRVWVDRWLPSLPLGHPVPLGGVAVTRNLRVCKLFCPFSREWDLNFLQPFLTDVELEAIRATPIGDSSRRDRLIWAASKNGRYSVKSGYRWIQSRSLSLRDSRLPHARSVPEELWKCLWKIEVPPKIRHFLWSSLHNALATNVNLFNRRASNSPICPICLCDDETTVHIFLRCPWVKHVWFGGVLSYKVDGSAISSWSHWLQAIFSSNFGALADGLWVRSCVAFTCWYIWKARCDFVFNHVKICPSRVVLAISSEMESFLAAGRSSEVGGLRDGVGQPPIPVVCWTPPDPPSTKINVDASWCRMSLSGFVGVVVRGAKGQFIAAARYSIRASNAAAAEALALLHGCKLGLTLGLSEVILESDSLEAVSCLSNSLDDGSWEAFPILAKVKEFGDSF
ncbi:unnamed protein product [Malus baccata var. baccata]